MFSVTILILVLMSFSLSAGNETGPRRESSENSIPNLIQNNRRRTISICPSGWHRFGSKCYHFNRSPATFHDTIKYCSSFPYNSKMVILHSREEEEFISRLIFIKFKDSSAWLGGTQVAPGSPDYKWIDGSSFNYSNWQEPDEPDCGASCCGIQLDYYEVDNIINTVNNNSNSDSDSNSNDVNNNNFISRDGNGNVNNVNSNSYSVNSNVNNVNSNSYSINSQSHLKLFNKTIKTFWRDVNCNKELKRICQIELTPDSWNGRQDGSRQSSMEDIVTENEIDEQNLKFQDITKLDFATFFNVTKSLDKKFSLLTQMVESLAALMENTQRTIIDTDINSSKNFYTIRAAHEEFRQLLVIFTRDDYYFRINWTSLLKQQSDDIRNLMDKSSMVSSCRKIFDTNLGQSPVGLNGTMIGSLSGSSDSLKDQITDSSNFPFESVIVVNSSSAEKLGQKSAKNSEKLEQNLIQNSEKSNPEEGQGGENEIITLDGLKRGLDRISKLVMNESKRLDFRLDKISRGQDSISNILSNLESIQKYHSLPAIMLVITLIITCTSLPLILSLYLNISAMKRSKCSCIKNSGQDFEMVHQRIDSNGNSNNLKHI